MQPISMITTEINILVQTLINMLIVITGEVIIEQLKVLNAAIDTIYSQSMLPNKSETNTIQYYIILVAGHTVTC